MYRLLIPHIKPSVGEIMIKSHWAPGLFELFKKNHIHISVQVRIVSGISLAFPLY